jgi:two-component system, LytTR family, response regulator
MKKAIIIDDELFCIEVMEELLKAHEHQIQIVATARSAQEGFEKINALKPDIVFLDIEMPKMTGFELLEKFATHNFTVVFTTAYDSHAIKAVKYSAIDYLLKPIDAGDLKNAINRFLATSENTNYTEQILLLKENMKYLNPAYIQRIAIPTTEALLMQPIADIVMCEASSSYTIIHTQNKPKITTAKTLKEYEEILEHHDFLRIHNSYLVNLNYVDKYIRGDGGTLMLSSGIELPVSRSKKDSLLNRLQRL